jgi:thiamine-phosphate pyrophosphorylase
VDGPARRARLARSRLYFVVEARPHGEDPAALLDAALRGGVDVVQLRDKELGDEELVAAAAPFRRACDAHGALFVLNDRPELVAACAADGVHVGQEDASVADARRAVGEDRLVGLSTHSVDELARAGGADYAGVGTIFATPTKPGNATVGLELVRAARLAAPVPWFAIGGIDRSNVAEVAAAGAFGVAVVRALRDAEDPETAARGLRAELPPSHPLVLGPGEGEQAGNGRIRALLPQLDVVEFGTAAGAIGAAPHTHAEHADAFFLFEGELAFRLGDETVRVPAGSFVVAPPGLVHGFRNPGGSEARALNLHAPGGWARLGRARARGEQVDPADFDTFGPDGAVAGVRGIAVGPGDGDRLVGASRLGLVKAELPHLAAFEFTLGPGYEGPPPHYHARHVDAFHVLEGELQLHLDGRTARYPAGTSIVVPPGVVHAPSNPGPGGVRFLDVHAPNTGFGDLVRRQDAGERPDPAAYDTHEPG